MRKLPQLNRGGDPCRDRGRVQVAAPRATSGRDIVTTADIAQNAFARKLLLGGRKLKTHHPTATANCAAAQRTLRQRFLSVSALELAAGGPALAARPAACRC